LKYQIQESQADKFLFKASSDAAMYGFSQCFCVPDQEQDLNLPPNLRKVCQQGSHVNDLGLVTALMDGNNSLGLCSEAKGY
jgi:hypothetical protein